MPRDPARIPRLLLLLELYWKLNPDLRLGQILCDANSGHCPCNMDDEWLEEWLDHELAGHPQ